MNLNLLVAAIAAGLSSVASAQAPTAPAKPGESPGPMTAERRCDALTGEKKERCLRDARRMPDSATQGSTARGSCDALIGPEKEFCLKRGGTVEAGAKAK